jgi:rare lipoprotein A
LPIVASGGFYAQPFYSREISTMSEEAIAEVLIGQAEADPIGAYGEIGSWDYITSSVMVRINDRGPFVRGRIIDLSPAAARAIGVSGVSPVSLKVGE